MANTPNDVLLNHTDFSGGVFTSKVLRGLRYRLILDGGILLKPSVNYDASDISFTLLNINIESDTTITMQFY